MIASVSTKYQMFSASGKLLRATCTVKLTEADVLAFAKNEGVKAKLKARKKAIEADAKAAAAEREAALISARA